MEQRSGNSPEGAEPSRLSRFFTDSLTRHLKVVSDWAVTMLYRGVQERGHTGIRRTHELVIVPMTLEGSRLTDVAQASAVSKNAIGQLAAELESLGYVQRHDHPDDKRAKLLRFTDQGLGLLTDTMAAGEALDEAVAEMIGEDKTRQLRALLEELAERIAARGEPDAPGPAS